MSYSKNFIQTQISTEDEFTKLLEESSFQSPKGKMGWTNAVLMQTPIPIEQQNPKQATKLQFYIPGYLRLKVKNFVSIALQDMKSTLNCTIMFTIYYGQLPEPLVKIFKNRFVMNLIRDQSISLKANFNPDNQQKQSNCQVIQNTDQGTIQYRIRKKVDLSFFPHISKQWCLINFMNQFDNSLWFSPFQIIDQILTIQIPRIQLIEQNQNESNTNTNWEKVKEQLVQLGLIQSINKKVKIGISVNLMDITDKVLQSQHNNWITLMKQNKSAICRQFRADDCQKIDIRKQPILGNYGIATKKINVFYSNTNYSKIYEKQIKQLQQNTKLLKIDSQNKIQKSNIQQCRETERGMLQEIKLYNLRSDDNLMIKKQQSQSLSNSKIKMNYKTNMINSIIQKKRKRKMEKTIKRQKQKHFLNAHFVIPAYKYPGLPIITIFVPLLLLVIINLTIYFQSTDLGSRTVSIGTLVIAYVAFIPVIRGQIPPYSGILMVQILIYGQTFTNLLCLLQSFWLRYEGKDALNFEQVGVFFVISLATSILTFFVITVLFVIHKLNWQKKYIYPKQNAKDYVNEYCKPKYLNILKWRNQKCDKYFNKKQDKIILFSDHVLKNQQKNRHKQYPKSSQSQTPLESLKANSRTSLRLNPQAENQQINN